MEAEKGGGRREWQGEEKKMLFMFETSKGGKLWKGSKKKSHHYNQLYGMTPKKKVKRGTKKEGEGEVRFQFSKKGAPIGVSKGDTRSKKTQS